MQKKKIGFILVIIFLSCCSFLWINKNHNKDYEQYNEKLEYITSINEIDKSLPTVIFFKGQISKDYSLDMEIRLKDLRENNEFNLLHVSLDDITNKEAMDIVDKYNIKEVPYLILKDKEGTDVKTYDYHEIEDDELLNSINELK